MNFFWKLVIYHSLLNDKKRSKYLVLGPGARRTFRLLSRTPRIPFNVLSRTIYIKFNISYIKFRRIETTCGNFFLSFSKVVKFQQPKYYFDTLAIKASFFLFSF